jgi:DNA repair protein RadD
MAASSSSSLTLRDYQARAINDLRTAYRSGVRAPLLVLPTGGGKTVVFAAITAGAVERGRRVLILVHRRELIRQASAKLTWAGVQHGVIAAGFEPSDHLVQVASVQTLVRRLERITWSPDLIVVDEAHHAVVGTWGSVLSHWPDAYRLGVTATPVRRDGRGLGSMFDRLVLGPSVQQLTAEGYLTAARIYAPAPAVQLDNLRIRSGDYAPEDAAQQLDKPTITGDAIEHFQRLASGNSAIAFCCTTQHAEHVAAQFRASGITSQVVLGETPIDVREELIAQLGAGLLQVLVSVDVISEGTDVPSVGCAILLRPTQSEGLYLQQVGRVLRPAPGKQAALILDHVGNVHRHGFPDDHREWTLDDARRRSRSGGPPAPSVRTCPSCFAAFRPQLLCPVCGTYCAPVQREIRQQEGELQEVRRRKVATVTECVKAAIAAGAGTVAEIQAWAKQHNDTVLSIPEVERTLKRVDEGWYRRAVAARKRQAGSARTLQELLAVAEQRGYSPGWAYRLHAARSHG